MLRGFTVEDGRDTGFGGGAAVKGTGTPEFINCRFLRNGKMTVGSTEVNTFAGGAIYVAKGGSVKLTNCLLYDNKAGDGGGIALDTAASATLINCTLRNNAATIKRGGGLNDGEGSATVRSCIFWGNTAVRGGAQIHNASGYVTDVTKSDVQGGFSGTGNIDADPLFVQGHKLDDASPCKNAGNNASLPNDVADIDWDTNLTEKIPLDLDLATRKVLFIVDMGCLEIPLGSGGS